jgi:hypothetical protein
VAPEQRDQLVEILAQQRLATGKPKLLDPEPGEDSNQAIHLLE